MEVLSPVLQWFKEQLRVAERSGKIGLDGSFAAYNSLIEKYMDGNEESGSLGSKEIFQEALQYLETMESLVTNTQDLLTREYYFSLLMDSLVRQAESINSDGSFPKDDCIFSSLSLLIFLYIQKEKQNHPLEECRFTSPPKNVLQDIYSQPTLYDAIVKSGFYCLKKLLPGSKNEFMASSNTMLLLAFHTLLLVFKDVHLCTPSTDGCAYPKESSLPFLVYCGLVSEDIQKEALEILSLPALFSKCTESQITFYKTVYSYFERFLLSNLNSSFGLISNLKMKPIEFLPITLQNEFFPNFLNYCAMSSVYFLPSDRSKLFSLLLSNDTRSPKAAVDRVEREKRSSILLSVSLYYSRKVHVDYVAMQELWACDLELLRLFSFCPQHKCHPSTRLIVLQAIFSGLDCLLDHLGHLTGNQQDCLAYYKSFSDYFVKLLTDEHSVYYSTLMTMDNNLHEALIVGWKHLVWKGIELIQDSGSGGFLFSFILAKTYQEAFQPQYQLMWNFLFEMSHLIVSSVEKILLRFWTLRHLKDIPLALRSELLRNDSGALNSSGMTDHDILPFFSSSLPFSKWYQNFREIIYKSYMSSMVSTLALLLRYSESGYVHASLSLETSSGDEIETDLNSLTPFMRNKTSEYRHKLKQAVGTCFKTFGLKIMLALPSLSLKRLCTASMSLPSFTFESNSWIIPFLTRVVCQDQLETFMQCIFPLIQGTEKKCQHLPTDDAQKLELRSYQCLNQQLWSLLPRLMDQAFDVLDVLSDNEDALICTLIHYLNVSGPRESICTALITLCLQLSHLIDPDFLSLTGKPHCISSTSVIMTPFLHEVWTDESGQVRDLTSIEDKANKLMRVLVARYLQCQVGPQEPHSQLTHTSQLLVDAMECLSLLCNSEILEQNLNNFSAMWTCVLDQCVSSILGNHSSDQTSTIKLSPTQSAALVDVCVALMYRLPSPRVYDLIMSFVKLIKDASVVLAKNNIPNPPRHQEPQSTVVYFKNTSPMSPGSCYECLRHILKKSYKGFQSAMLRLIHGKETESHGKCIDPKTFMDIWKVFITYDSVARKHVTTKFIMGVLFSIIEFFCYSKSSWESSLSKNELETMVDQLMKDLTPILLLGFSDANKFARKKAVELFHLVLRDLAPGEQIIKYILPGFASQVPYVRSSTIAAFTLLLRSYGDGFSQDTLKELLKIGILFLKDKNKCVFRSAIKLMRTLQRFVPEPLLLERLEEILGTTFSSTFCTENRLAVRYMTEKLITRLGHEAVEKVFPSTHLPLFAYISKSLRKRKGKREHQQKNSSYDVEFSDEQDACSNQPILDTNNTAIKNNREEALSVQRVPNLLCLVKKWRKETAVEPVNQHAKKRKRCDSMSDEDITDHLVLQPVAPSDAAFSSKTQRRRQIQDYTSSRDTALNGKMVLELDDQNSDPKNENNQPFIKKKSDTKIRLTPGTSLTDLKALRDARAQRKKNHGQKAHFVEKSSHSFKSKKASGDIANANDVAPYAYIRLNPKLAKEKHRSSVLKGFKNELTLKKMKRQRKM